MEGMETSMKENLSMEIDLPLKENLATAEDWQKALDKSRGIILTNRYVVKPGPVVEEAMFVNREEVPVYTIYRDSEDTYGLFSKPVDINEMLTQFIDFTKNLNSAFCDIDLVKLVFASPVMINP
ncbi:protease Do-like 7 [Phtheirospermum japonicum]|uniref:Protease Do-like 7 n=1 Tax=Phtheirospermum japonicum TaxID=374723 RepID=A0A830BUX0_9LAMI|nr:protease Do-like 7 [Phtheirospermum japonicum]